MRIIRSHFRQLLFISSGGPFLGRGRRPCRRLRARLSRFARLCRLRRLILPRHGLCGFRRLRRLLTCLTRRRRFLRNACFGLLGLGFGLPALRWRGGLCLAARCRLTRCSRRLGLWLHFLAGALSHWKH
ncbi:hypothetical protein M0534_06915 [Methylonatrum kenyense]|uniref:hypothetical protein n=1 Tax=Methylonatrum kenyense TaxID=455253 RepID=UPI0020BE2720|nr:hypothetical protein [Methylonatrum kenyense]MCK8516054.1 hypothetical protein [Methylonatrum kenyense]